MTKNIFINNFSMLNEVRHMYLRRTFMSHLDNESAT